MSDEGSFNLNQGYHGTPKQYRRELASPRRLARLGQRVNCFVSDHPFRGGYRISAVATRILIGRPRGLTVCATRHGFSLAVDPTSGDTVDKSIFLKGTYEAGTIDVMKRCLGRGDVFVDVGSHIGLMALAASKFVGGNGVVHAFEPEAANLVSLRRNIAMNAVGNIRVHSVALGSCPGKAFASGPPNARASAWLTTERPQDGLRAQVAVETLERVLGCATASPSTPPVRMIKVDVEGWELDVLKGAREILAAPHAPILCVECSVYGGAQTASPVDLYNFILSINDYCVYRLERSKERPSRMLMVSCADQLPRHDNLFCFTPRHLSTVPRSMFRR